MYFELYKKGNLIIRGRKMLSNIEFDHELNLAPSVTIDLDGSWIPLIDGREEVKIYLDDGKVFWGIIWGYPIDKDAETISLDIRHIITEWQYRQISVNHAMSNEELNIVYKGDKVVKDEGNDEAITATSFTVMSKHLSDMTDADWISKSFAAAWVISNGDKVQITKVDHSKVQSTEGTYKVTFATAKGTSIEVDCEVADEIAMGVRETHSSRANRETISAVPFTVYVDKGMTKADVIKKADPKAWVYRHKSQKVAVTSVVTDFENAEGEYTLTASTALGTSITVTITVEAGNQYSSLDDPAVIDKLEDIFNDKNFAYPGWEIDFQDGAENRMVDYVYSKQNKLDALTTTVELTDDLWWRVGFWNEKRVEIGKFGEEKPYTLSLKPSGKTNIRIIAEPQIDPDIENVVNVATVYSDKSDGGMSSLTLREVYNDPSLQKKGFPVVILHANVNNERDYEMYIDQYPKLAPNNEVEYAVIDEESVALESGTIIEGSYSFNDLSPFETDGDVITDEKRVKASQTVYERIIKKLIQSRRDYHLTVATEALPKDVLAGDKVRLLYDNSIFNLDACSNYWKKLLKLDEYWYITRISYAIDEYGNETNEVTLSKWLKIERETANTQG